MKRDSAFPVGVSLRWPNIKAMSEPIRVEQSRGSEHDVATAGGSVSDVA